MYRNIEELKSQLSEPKEITIITHYNPDGDALGSSLALRHYLTGKGHKVTCIVPNNFPNYLEWMPGSDSVIIANKHLNTAHKHILNCDILFAVDMNGAHRSGKELEEVIDQSTAYRIHIDHHINPMFSCNFCFSETTTTSTCEMVYRFINEYLDDIQSLSKEAAECIYSGIITDTGSLSYSCNHTITYRILEHLISLGVNGEAIHRLIYDNYSTSRLRLLGVALNNLKIMEELETSYMYLSKKELQENEFKDGDTEGFVNYGLSLRCVKFTAFFTEKENRIRISFRSKGDFDVNTFASTYFSGGGHKNAAASYHYDTLENTIKYFEEVVCNHPELKK